MDTGEKPDGSATEVAVDVDVEHAATVHPHLPRWRFDGWIDLRVRVLEDPAERAEVRAVAARAAGQTHSPH